MKKSIDFSKVTAYELIKEHPIKELDTFGYILRHKKTGARVVLMDNDDDDKVFYIGFRTPPTDSTGVMHILEHSVLCGSKNYPVKDPFLELAKGSLNTFLNAMTYPDKTVYPIASCNDKDFKNLMGVYLDAVFFPRILDNDLTFRQEGWHYELPDKDSELTINGVVYSEMKGAFSSPDDVLQRELFNSLFPDTSYGVESGGDPKNIPDLTYEAYLDTYRKYYHPSNSYIYLYGNMDFVERLEYMDREYLSGFDAIKIDSAIKDQKPFDSPVTVEKEYSITEAEPVEENTYLCINYAMKSNLDPEEYIAWQVIDYALCSAQGAVLKEVLLDAGIGKDVYSIYDNGVKQPYFSIVAKYSDPEKKDEFVKLTEQTLKDIVKNGLKKETLKAALNLYEFRYREADFGNYPPGLMYGLQVLDSWLYDDDKPFIHIEAEATYKSLRDKIDTDYYERLIQTGLLTNNHRSVLTVRPTVGLVAKEEDKLKAKLAAYKASLSDEDIDKLVADTAALLEYQEKEDDPETLKCIPMLKIADIRKETDKLYNDLRESDGLKVLYHPVNTRGIDYIRLIFDTKGISKDLFPYLSMLKNMIGLLDTQNYTYQELFDKIFIETGGIAAVINNSESVKTPGNVRTTFEITGKCLAGDLEKVFDLYSEIILKTKYEDTDRLFDLINEIKSRVQSQMISAGHTVASQRALSYISKSAAMQDAVGGLSAYRLLESIECDFENKKDDFYDKMKALSKEIFTSDRLMIDFAGSEEEYGRMLTLAAKLKEKLGNNSESAGDDAFTPVISKKNEGFKSASQVQYVCRAGNFLSKGLKYTGALRVLKVIMGYDYLWNNIRVKGGAYGCMSGFGKNGDAFFVSYRDPNLKNTIDIYKNAPEFVENFEADERKMTQNIIGAIGSLDVPLTPQGKAVRSLGAYMTDMTEEDFQKERDELLATDCDTIRGLAGHIRALLSDECICVVGSETKIEEDKKLFDNIEPLFNS